MEKPNKNIYKNRKTIVSQILFLAIVLWSKRKILTKKIHFYGLHDNLKMKTLSINDRVGHPFFSKERNVLTLFGVLFKRTKYSLHSFTFFIKERGVLLHSFTFFTKEHKRTLRSFWFHKSHKNDKSRKKM